jgi:hypothetical protein
MAYLIADYDRPREVIAGPFDGPDDVAEVMASTLRDYDAPIMVVKTEIWEEITGLPVPAPR